MSTLRSSAAENTRRLHATCRRSYACNCSQHVAVVCPRQSMPCCVLPALAGVECAQWHCSSCCWCGVLAAPSPTAVCAAVLSTTASKQESCCGPARCAGPSTSLQAPPPARWRVCWPHQPHRLHLIPGPNDVHSFLLRAERCSASSVPSPLPLLCCPPSCCCASQLLTRARSSRRCGRVHGSATHQPLWGWCCASCAGSARTSSSGAPGRQRC